MALAIPAQYDGWVTLAAAQNGVRKEFLAAVLQTESNWNPNARSGAGAVGIAQFMPGTAAGIGVNPLNAQQSIFGAAKLLGQYEKQFGSEDSALVAYNAGPGTVGHSLPSETQNYIKTIKALAGGTASVTTGDTPADTGSAGLSNLTKLLHNVGDPGFWARIGKGAAGVAIVLVGAWFLMAKTETGKQVQKSITANVL